jgi:hypothetical protein
MANSEGSDNMLNRVMPKDNIGLAALLKTKEAAWENGKNCSIHHACIPPKVQTQSYNVLKYKPDYANNILT